MNDVCEGPCLRRGQERYAENEAVQNGDGSQIAEPHAAIIEPVLVSVRP